MSRLVKPSRRHILKGIPRIQWDPIHPGPIAARIKPNAVDLRGNRYQLLDLPLGPKQNTAKAWIRKPSPNQKRFKCFLCKGNAHNPKNEACTSLSKRAQKRKYGTNQLFSFPEGKPFVGKWVRVETLIPPRYSSGQCTFKVQ